MQSELTIDNMLKLISAFPLDDQLMISEIIQKRATEQQRNILAENIKLSRSEYEKGLTGSGSINDFLKDIEAER
ncbi:MAG: hypothetical protein V1720_08025 [bacterium]